MADGKKRDSAWDRLALLLWRDRDGYDEATQTVTEMNNISLRTRFRDWRRVAWRGVKADRSWIVPMLVGVGAALATTWATLNYDRIKTEKQMKADAGEILLKCRQDRDGVYACRKVAN